MEITNEIVGDYLMYSWELTRDNKYYECLCSIDSDSGDVTITRSNEEDDKITVKFPGREVTIDVRNIISWLRSKKLKKLLEGDEENI